MNLCKYKAAAVHTQVKSPLQLLSDLSQHHVHIYENKTYTADKPLPAAAHLHEDKIDQDPGHGQADQNLPVHTSEVVWTNFRQKNFRNIYYLN